MKVKRRITMTSEVSMATMSDIAFLLIIFFMVASAFILRDGLHLQLPDKNKKPVPVSSINVATISVIRGDSYRYNDKIIKRDDILDLILKSKAEKEELYILIKIKENVQYKYAIDVIEIVRVAGIKKLSIRMI